MSDQAVENIDRNENTLVEVLVKDRAEAQAKYKELAQSQPVTWVELTTQSSFFEIDHFLGTQPTDASIFLYIPFTQLSWDECHANLISALDDILFDLWPKELKLYLAHSDGAFNF